MEYFYYIVYSYNDKIDGQHTCSACLTIDGKLDSFTAISTLERLLMKKHNCEAVCITFFKQLRAGKE